MSADTAGMCPAHPAAMLTSAWRNGQLWWTCEECGEAYGPEADHPVALLNTSIATEDGTYRLRTVTRQEALALIRGRALVSAIGHEATALALTEILGWQMRAYWSVYDSSDQSYGDLVRRADVPVSRIPFAQQPHQVALVFKLRGRPAEGAVLSRAEVEAAGYDLKVLERTA